MRGDALRTNTKLTIAASLRHRVRGLLGAPPFDGVLMLVPCSDIHTHGMKCAIDVAFLARDGLVLEAHRSVTPGSRLRCRGSTAVLERVASSDPWYAKGDRFEVCCAELGEHTPTRVQQAE